MPGDLRVFLADLGILGSRYFGWHRHRGGSFLASMDIKGGHFGWPGHRRGSLLAGLDIEWGHFGQVIRLRGSFWTSDEIEGTMDI